MRAQKFFPVFLIVFLLFSLASCSKEKPIDLHATIQEKITYFSSQVDSLKKAGFSDWGDFSNFLEQSQKAEQAGFSLLSLDFLDKAERTLLILKNPFFQSRENRSSAFELEWGKTKGKLEKRLGELQKRIKKINNSYFKAKAEQLSWEGEYLFNASKHWLKIGYYPITPYYLTLGPKLIDQAFLFTFFPGSEQKQESWLNSPAKEKLKEKISKLENEAVSLYNQTLAQDKDIDLSKANSSLEMASWFLSQDKPETALLFYLTASESFYLTKLKTEGFSPDSAEIFKKRDETKSQFEKKSLEKDLSLGKFFVEKGEFTLREDLLLAYVCFNFILPEYLEIIGA